MGAFAVGLGAGVFELAIESNSIFGTLTIVRSKSVDARGTLVAEIIHAIVDVDFASISRKSDNAGALEGAVGVDAGPPIEALGGTEEAAFVDVRPAIDPREALRADALKLVDAVDAGTSVETRRNRIPKVRIFVGCTFVDVFFAESPSETWRTFAREGTLEKSHGTGSPILAWVGRASASVGFVAVDSDEAGFAATEITSRGIYAVAMDATEIGVRPAFIHVDITSLPGPPRITGTVDGRPIAATTAVSRTGDRFTKVRNFTPLTTKARETVTDCAIEGPVEATPTM